MNEGRRSLRACNRSGRSIPSRRASERIIETKSTRIDALAGCCDLNGCLRVPHRAGKGEWNLLPVRACHRERKRRDWFAFGSLHQKTSTSAIHSRVSAKAIHRTSRPHPERCAPAGSPRDHFRRAGVRFRAILEVDVHNANLAAFREGFPIHFEVFALKTSAANLFSEEPVLHGMVDVLKKLPIDPLID